MRPIPPDFRRALEQNGLSDYFVEGAFVPRAAYLSWIGEARRPKTRRAKIREAVSRLLAHRAEHTGLSESRELRRRVA